MTDLQYSTVAIVVGGLLLRAIVWKYQWDEKRLQEERWRLTRAAIETASKQERKEWY